MSFLIMNATYFTYKCFFFDNAFLNAKYSCIEPTVIQGEDNSTALCQIDEEWTPVSLTCLPVPCGDIPPVANSKVEYKLDNEIFWAHFTCDSGLSGGKVQCIVFGELAFWGRDIIQCEVMFCGDAPDVANANKTETGQRHLSTVTYVCSAGFSLTSVDDTRTCQPDGAWSNEEVICSPVMCDPPTLPENIELGKGETLKKNYINDYELSLTCKIGYEMVLTTGIPVPPGEIDIKCLDGNWTLLDTQVFCVPSSCALLPPLPHTTWELLAGDPPLAAFKCETGYIFENVKLLDANITITLTCDPLLGWNVPPNDIIRCKVDCGSITLSPDSGIQIPNNYFTSYESTVEVACISPLYRTLADNTTVCQADGQWSLIDPSQLCAPCNQRSDAAGIEHGILNIIISAGVIGDEANFTCADGFFPLGISDPVQCASVHGAPTWQGLENVTCFQTKWLNPIALDGNFAKYIAFVHMAAVTHGLKACGEVTFVGPYRLWLVFSEIYEDGELKETARFSYYKGTKVNYLRLYFNRGGAEYQLESLEKLTFNLMSRDETAKLCLNLDLEEQKFKFTKNGDLVAEMDVLYYRGITHFIIKEQVEVSMIQIEYY
ncbi:sushi, von Willebrand factor type a, egf and pentraxin domain-containing protein 1 [Plakobranchus ocellatus]|uniref:Sushi, von Willebrand factor type a, egf and pentraxin domain-containing protein 1 n=1 Tax=Plakobranchus ocellatus TaxID=259542 RepID=A0AAV4CY72_9GAST|nr:sushi, von Willebrand factor type a, egf and pentraxin domain-containing protein 1 [Plakobranchus ocellatus]